MLEAVVSKQVTNAARTLLTRGIPMPPSWCSGKSTHDGSGGNSAGIHNNDEVLTGPILKLPGNLCIMGYAQG
jgi:hypothetical protein